MRVHVYILGVALLLGLALTACGQPTPTPTAAADPTATPPTSAPATPTATRVAPTPTAVTTPITTSTPATTPTAFQVSIKNITLLDITIAVGTTLTWANGDAVPHILGSGKDGKIDTAGWKSTNLNPGQSFSQTFSSTGTFSYTCQIHPTMNATLTVAQPGTPSSSAPASSGGTSGGGESYDYY